MTVLATRGGARLVDDGGGMAHMESGAGVSESKPVDVFLKWGYWRPVDEEPVTAAGKPIPGEGPLIRLYLDVLSRSARRTVRNYRRAMRGMTAAGWDESEHPRHPEGHPDGGKFKDSRIHYGVPQVTVEPFEFEDTRGRRYLVDRWSGEGEFDTRATGILIKKNGELGNVLSHSIHAPMPPKVAAEMRRLQEELRRQRREEEGLTAAGEPDLERVLDEDALSRDQQRKLKAAREKIAKEAAFAQAVQFGISFTVANPFLPGLIEEHAGRQAERIVAGSREIAASVIRQSREEGWSVPQTATALHERLEGAKKWQATMLARTDLIGLNNGASYMLAKALGSARPLYKRWINADDEKVRPTHVEAMNQVVPFDQPFQVGEASLLYPGDPHGPDGEVINCRCTLVYGDTPDGWTDPLWEKSAIFAAGWNEADHPRDPGGEGGGQFIETDTAGADPLTGDEAIAEWEKLGPPIVPDPELEAVYAYQGAWYSAINHHLRDPVDFQKRLKRFAPDGDPKAINSFQQVNHPTEAKARVIPLPGVTAEVESQIGLIDRVLRPSPADMVVYRYNYGPSLDPEQDVTEDLFGPYDQLELVEGQTVTDAGFQSTTLDRTWAEKRLAGDNDGILHRIRVPKGTLSSYLPRITGEGSFSEEKEMLLARGLSMKAVKVVRDGRKYTIDWEVQT